MMLKFVAFFVIGILFGNFRGYTMDDTNGDNFFFVGDNAHPLSWNQRVGEYARRITYGEPSSSDPQYHSRIDRLRSQCGIKDDSNGYLDKIEENHIRSIAKDLGYLLMLLNPTKSAHDLTAIKLMQDSILSQVYRLARFRPDQIYQYLQLAEKINESNLKAQVPQDVGPVNVNYKVHESVERNWTPFMKKSFGAWFNYIANTYSFKELGDSIMVMNNIADLVSFPEVQIILKEQLGLYVEQTFWCQIEYSYKQIFDEYPLALTWQEPYMSIFPGISTAPKRTLKPVYTTVLENLILSGVLTKTISETDKDMKLSIENSIKGFNKILSYIRLEELIRVFLSPVESLIKDSPIGIRDLKDEEKDYALSELYLLGSAVVLGHIPKKHLQRLDEGQVENIIDSYYQRIPFKDLRNIGLIIHHARYLKRPWDKEAISQRLPDIINDLKKLIDPLRELIDLEIRTMKRTDLEERDLLSETPEKVSRLSLEALGEIGSYSNDVSVLFKIINPENFALIQEITNKKPGNWPKKKQKSFIRILGILGEGSKHLSPCVKNYIGNDLVWKNLCDLRDKIIIHGSRQKLETFLKTAENEEKIINALKEIQKVVFRSQKLYNSELFRLGALPDPLQPLDARLGQHLEEFYSSLKAANEPTSTQPKISSYVTINPYVARQEVNREELKLELMKRKSFIEEKISKIERILASKKPIGNLLGEEIDLLLLTEQEKGKIKSFFQKEEYLLKLIQEIQILIETNDQQHVSDENRKILLAFFNFESITGEAEVEQIKKIIASLPTIGNSKSVIEGMEDSFFMLDDSEDQTHPLMDKLEEFIGIKNELFEKLNNINEIINNIKDEEKIEERTKKTIDDIFNDNEIIKNNLLLSLEVDTFSGAVENEIEAINFLKENLAPFGICSSEELFVWLKYLRYHHGLIFEPKSLMQKNLKRAKHLAENLLQKFKALDDLTREGRKLNPTVQKEKWKEYWSDNAICLAIEDELETIRNISQGIEECAKYIRSSSPEIAAILAMQMNAFLMFSNYLAHIDDATGFNTKTQLGRNNQLLNTLNIIFGNPHKKQHQSFVEVVNFFVNYIQNFDVKEINTHKPTLEVREEGKEPQKFKVIPIALDGNCGFNALGISRELAIYQLLINKNNLAIRQAVSQDIKQALIAHSLPFNLKNKSIHLCDEYHQFQNEIDIVRRNIMLEIPDLSPLSTINGLTIISTTQRSQGNKALARKISTLVNLLKQQEVLDIKIQEFTQDEANYVEFVLNEFGRGAWLSYVRGGQGTLYALALINDFNVHIWCHGQQGLLQAIPLAPGLKGKTIHLLHTNNLTHFERLEPFSEQIPCNSNQESIVQSSLPIPTSPFVWKDITYKFSPSLVGDNLYQGGVSLTVLPYSNNDIEVSPKSNGDIEIKYKNYRALIDFSPIRSSRGRDIVHSIKEKSSEKIKIIQRNKGLTFFFEK